jgi:probable HAF family extracellular repeat protein
MQDLGLPPGFTSGTTISRGINAAGDIVGDFQDQDVDIGLLWKSDGTLVELNSLPDNEGTTAYAINDLNQVVGAARSAAVVVNGIAERLAWIWQNGDMQDLNTLIDPSDPLKPYVQFTSATSINDAGQIAALGFDSRTGTCARRCPVETYLLVPSSGP